MSICKKILAFCFILTTLPGFAKEEILDYAVDIKVNSDASIQVKERIKVRAEGKRIKRGIVRWLPMTYGDYKIESVLLNGHESNYHIKIQKGFKVIYVGSEAIRLPKGEYQYEIRYRTRNQLRYFKDFDEMYWNVTGTGWKFPIEKVYARVTLPNDAEIRKITAYTGVFGSTQQNYESQKVAPNIVEFTTTEKLKKGQGITIAVTWPKGIVLEPTLTQKIYFLFTENENYLYGAMILGILFLSMISTLLRVGQDPEKGVIVPRFMPPSGIAPGTMRFIMKMGFDNRTISAAIVSLATKGYLKIEEDGKDNAVEKSGDKTGSLSLGEQVLYDRLFEKSDKIEFDSENAETIREIFNAYEEKLEEEYVDLYFKRNDKHLVIPIITSLMLYASQVYYANDIGQAFFITVWLSIWCFVLGTLSQNIIEFLKEKLSSRIIGPFFNIIVFFILATPCIGILVFAFVFLSEVLPVLSCLMMFAAFGLVTWLFIYIKQPIIQGRAVMDEIEGFKLFLDKTEKYRLNEEAPELNLQLFESYLPYAIALEVDNNWGNFFTSQISAAQQKNTNYRPLWYSWNNWSSRNCGAFSSAVASCIATSAMASTSSGSSGGFSGGGGGGW